MHFGVLTGMWFFRPITVHRETNSEAFHFVERNNNNNNNNDDDDDNDNNNKIFIDPNKKPISLTLREQLV